VSDVGVIEKESGERAELVETLRLENDQELVFRGEGFAEGDRVKAIVPWNIRYPTQANHHGHARPPPSASARCSAST